MWGFYADWDQQVDVHLEKLKSFIRDAAIEVFGKPVASPLKPWVSQKAWVLVARLARLRRLFHAARKAMSASVTLACFLVWASLRHRACVRGEEINGATSGLGWMAAARLAPVVSLCQVACRFEAIAFHSISLVQNTVKPSLHEDRMTFCSQLAAKAQICTHMGDLRGTYTIAKRLCGVKVRPPRVVKLSNGTLCHDEASRKQRWTEHFAEVLSGTIVPDASFTATCPQSVSEGTLDASPVRMYTAIQKLGRNRGLGLDSIPA